MHFVLLQVITRHLHGESICSGLPSNIQGTTKIAWIEPIIPPWEDFV